MKVLCIVYNLLMLAGMVVLCPLWVPLVRLREKYRKTFRKRLWMEALRPERRGGASTPAPSTIWIHALSVGEVLSAEPLVGALAGRHGAENLIFTASTHTGMQTALRVIAPHVRAVRHFPYDTLFSVKRALTVIQPRKVVIVETDLWPNFLYQLNRCAIPVFLVNARVSGRSYRGYKRLAAVVVPLLSMFNRICVQSARDRERFLDLGVPREKIVLAGNLKFDQSPVSIAVQERERLSAELGLGENEALWVAGSTHPHEEAMLGRAYLRIRDAVKGLTLIVAPRDPGRATDVCGIFRGQGIPAVTVTQLEKRSRPSGAAVVVDRLGMLRDLYALATVTFVGGSLVKAGGHNPLEPASAAKPILFGPYTDDFEWISRTLETAGGAIRVANEVQTAEQVRELMLSRAKRVRMGKISHSVFHTHQGAVNRAMGILDGESAGPMRVFMRQ